MIQIFNRISYPTNRKLSKIVHWGKNIKKWKKNNLPFSLVSLKNEICCTCEVHTNNDNAQKTLCTCTHTVWITEFSVVPNCLNVFR